MVERLLCKGEFFFGVFEAFVRPREGQAYFIVGPSDGVEIEHFVHGIPQQLPALSTAAYARFGGAQPRLCAVQSHGMDARDVFRAEA